MEAYRKWPEKVNVVTSESVILGYVLSGFRCAWTREEMEATDSGLVDPKLRTEILVLIGRYRRRSRNVENPSCSIGDPSHCFRDS